MQRDDNHAIQNARGWSATITALVAAMNADYDRLGELRDERDSLTSVINAESDAEARADAEHELREWDAENGEELRELEATVKCDGEVFDNAEDVCERIEESALSVQIRSGWYSPGDTPEPEEFEILLTTGGPALRIRGELDEHREPRRAWLEWQDWGTPWTEFHGEGAPSQDDLVTFASSFFFGE